MINLKRLKLMRSAARVTRFHTMPTLRTQSVGEHTFGALAVLCEICDPSATLLRAVLYHDATEPCTGDTPAHVKWLNPGIAEAMKLAEGMLEDRFELYDRASLSEGERRILKYCDSMEAILFACEEFTMGNRLAAYVVMQTIGAIEKRGLTNVTPQAFELFNHVKLYAESLDIQEYAAGHYLHGKVEL
jgi:5'-deoxynucleotidase YfbR-like HD superfamily hydrolase